MKIREFYIVAFFVVILAGCGLDNYDPPKSVLSGQIVYEGQSIGLRGTGEAVQLQLYQDGYDLHDNISVFVDQEGSFKALLFDGQYKMVTRDKNGPWVNNRDTTLVNVSGDTEIVLNVTPYYIINSPMISLSGTSLTASFDLNKIVNEAELDYFSLLVSETSFVDDVSNIYRKDFRDIKDTNINLVEELAIDSQRPLFARIGVRAVGADQSIYSDIVQIR